MKIAIIAPPWVLVPPPAYAAPKQCSTRSREERTRPLCRMIARTVPVIAISHHRAESADDTPITGVIHHGVDVDAHPIGGGEGDISTRVASFPRPTPSRDGFRSSSPA